MREALISTRADYKDIQYRRLTDFNRVFQGSLQDMLGCSWMPKDGLDDSHGKSLADTVTKAYELV